MPPQTILILSYIAFIWLVILHTLEEISSGVMDIRLGQIQLTPKRYLFGASTISTLNLGTLALLVLNLPAGYYLGLFTSAVFGVFQALVHAYGYLRDGRRTQGLGAGFYSSIPLAVAGLIVLLQCFLLIK